MASALQRAAELEGLQAELIRWADRALVVDADRGSVVCSGQAVHAVSAGMGRSESDPADWLHSLLEALASGWKSSGRPAPSCWRRA
jgi:hypothetical protein